MASKVAVVTGSNKGIGFATVRALAKQFNGIVYLTGWFSFHSKYE
jgi:carbonyl reductase 1